MDKLIFVTRHSRATVLEVVSKDYEQALKLK